jgi:hypothetical protein
MRPCSNRLLAGFLDSCVLGPGRSCCGAWLRRYRLLGDPHRLHRGVGLWSRRRIGLNLRYGSGRPQGRVGLCSRDWLGLEFRCDLRRLNGRVGLCDRHLIGKDLRCAGRRACHLWRGAQSPTGVDRTQHRGGRLLSSGMIRSISWQPMGSKCTSCKCTGPDHYPHARADDEGCQANPSLWRHFAPASSGELIATPRFAPRDQSSGVGRPHEAKFRRPCQGNFEDRDRCRAASARYRCRLRRYS